jgi:hypothetical protein
MVWSLGRRTRRVELRGRGDFWVAIPLAEEKPMAIQSLQSGDASVGRRFILFADEFVWTPCDNFA